MALYRVVWTRQIAVEVEAASHEEAIENLKAWIKEDEVEVLTGEVEAQTDSFI